MMRKTVLTIMGLIIAALASRHAAAQEAQLCQPYYTATTAPTGGAVPVVPDSLLSDIKVAVPCLIGVLESLKGTINAPKLPVEGGSKLLSATGALRAIMARQTALDASTGNAKETKALGEFVKLFRGRDNLNVASVLTYAARSDVYDARLNAVLLLGNVIDNTTVCVPIAHLNDRALATTDYGINGRANLLGIVSVVAPWAYRENYDAIQMTARRIGQNLENATGVETTRSLLDNIQKRLESQTNNTNKGVNLPDEFRAACKAYLSAYQPPLGELGFSY